VTWLGNRKNVGGLAKPSKKTSQANKKTCQAKNQAKPKTKPSQKPSQVKNQAKPHLQRSGPYDIPLGRRLLFSSLV
jgi:hypothetical protein